MRSIIILILGIVGGEVTAAPILHYADLNTRQIEALDRQNTVVLIPGGILEEHGPYLPSGADTHMSAHVTQALAEAIASETPHTVLLLPPLILGSDAANVIGDRFPYSGSLTVRPDTLRQVYMDYGDALGEAGFRTVLLMHIHGAPRQHRALDQAGDYFHDTWGGTLLHLYGLLDVQEGGRAARAAMSDEAIAAQGYCVHGCAQEHGSLLYLRPDPVDDGYTDAEAYTAESRSEMFDIAKRDGWPGYFGSPRYATAKMGELLMADVTARAIAVTLKVLDGADPRSFARHSDQAGQPTAETPHARQLRQRQQKWLGKHRH